MNKFAALITVFLAFGTFAGSLAPVNPAFLRWQRGRQAAPAASKTSRPLAAVPGEDGGMGLRPSPLDLSYLKNLNAGAVKAPSGAGFPRKYDLRSDGLLTPVKNQNPYMTCWAHAACASLESWLLKSEGVTADFSEKNMASRHGFDWEYDDGGNMQIAAAYLLRWLGPVDESSDPYRSSSASASSAPVRHVQSVKVFPGRKSAADNNRIKRAVLDFGAVYVNYCHDSMFYDSRNCSYYCPCDYPTTHAVTVVGWDDSFSRTKFANIPNGVSPPGNGAWIVRNSWGENWGDHGYFYVSYYDGTFGYNEVAAFANAEPTDNYAGVYQYDDYGWVMSYGESSSEAYGANIFKATDAAALAAVGFYAAVPNAGYTITIRTGVDAGDPSSGELRHSQSGRADYAGFLTVPLSETVPLARNQNFAVIVRFKTPGFSYPVPVDCYIDGYSSSSTSRQGESFFSADGLNWNDLYAENKSMNVCIKAYTKGTAAVMLQSVEIDGETSLASGASADYACRAVYSDGSTAVVQPKWSVFEGSAYATVSASGRLTARTVDSSAEVTLKAVYAEGGVERTATMGVRILCGRPDVVTGLSATDTEPDAVRLSWEPAANAETYSVYRANLNDARKARYLGDTRGETTFADTTATPGETYWYFVKAVNVSGASRNFSGSAAGVRLLSAPDEVRAADGASYDSVSVSWSEAPGARCYRVWRKTASGADEPVPVSGFLAATIHAFEDTSAVADVRYTYFVSSALDDTGRLESALTTCDNGYRRMLVVLNYVTVNGPSTVAPGTTVPFTADAVYSDGSVRAGVAAAWAVESSVTGMTIDSSGSLKIPDSGESASIVVRATFGGKSGEKQVVLVLPRPDSVTGLVASQGTNPDKVSLTWNAAVGAVTYAVYRDGARIAETAAHSYADSTATPGALYVYSVRGVNASGESDSAPTASGYRRLAAPTQVMASYGVYADRIRIKWRDVVGAASYRVFRSESATGTKTPVSPWVSATDYDDITAAAETAYCYFVQAAATADGERAGATSAAAEGFRKRVVTLESLAINGPDSVQSGESVRYTATATYSDGSAEEACPTDWRVTGDAAVGSDGTLSTTLFTGGEEKTVTLSASFNYGGFTKSATKSVRLTPVERRSEVTELSASQRFPFNGLVDIDFTLANTPSDTRAEVSFTGRDLVTGRDLTPRTVIGETAGLESGDHRLTWDLAADYPGYHTESLTVDLVAAPMPEMQIEIGPGGHGCVQLWENGPFWATANVGAEEPEDTGYYFWWGDTVGYRADTVAAKSDGESSEGVVWVSSADERMERTPFSDMTVPIFGMTDDELRFLGYIDSSDCLTAAHDAATRHWGEGWRLPTNAEMRGLATECDTIWTMRNGVYGRLIRGRGEFARNSIFLPVSGYGYGVSLICPATRGYCWSSLMSAGNAEEAWYLYFNSSEVDRDSSYRYCGRTVRPVRGFASTEPGQLSFPLISAFTAAGHELTDGRLELNLTIAAGAWPTNAVSISFSAKDDIGGTNLTVNTLIYDAGQSAAISSTGGYHVVWNAAADLGRVMLSNVTLTATLTENNCPSGRTVSRMTSAAVDTCINSYTVTFDANGGSVSPTSKSYNYNETLGRLPTGQRTGYTFAGWYTAASGGTQVTSSTVVTGAVTYYAHWTKVEDTGVQLWENGPYWAECNVGATKPEETGYYFWWGDTVGYKCNAANNGWVSVKDGTAFSFSEENCPTYGKSDSQLQSAGYIDSTGNLVAAHDAAATHWGGEWRMPTDAEFGALISNCTTIWTTRNGVYGRLVTGKGDYASKSIFLPAAGFGNDSYLPATDAHDGVYWSSTPYLDCATILYIYCDGIRRNKNYRSWGQPVRPVRGFAGSCTVTFNANGGIVSPASKSYAYSTTLGTLPTPTRTGYTFAGWFTSLSNGMQVTSSTMVLGAVTYYALWIQESDLGYVQLWENGPYWAERNVGATKPEDAGYYFWWGDTVGYKPEGGAVDQYEMYTNVTWVSSMGTRMRLSPFGYSTNCPTCGKTVSQLQSAGYIDSTGNLAAAHDAATAHWGAGWRMPTSAEIDALTSKCTTFWMMYNGVYGRLVMGKGAYSSKSIFLPAAGYGGGSILDGLGSCGLYSSSTPDPDYSDYFYMLWFQSIDDTNLDNREFTFHEWNRDWGLSVRPVRGFAVTFDANGGSVSPTSKMYNYNETLGTLPTGQRTGYTFAGWYTAASGGTQVTSSTVVTGAVTYYAHWTKVEDTGVQLWENGPYWAECNVGATKPEETGYYFWWGDTVGYKRNAADDGWVSVKDGKAFSFYTENCPTFNKDNSALQSAGYVDSTGNLVAAHDAAATHWGGEWRMPTDAEFGALISNCTTTWTTRNGVYGRLVTGKGDYASKSIFLPAAGDGSGSRLYGLGSDGFYWSSTPNSGNSNDAWGLYFYSSSFHRLGNYRSNGQSVRPLRGFAK